MYLWSASLALVVNDRSGADGDYGVLEANKIFFR